MRKRAIWAVALAGQFIGACEEATAPDSRASFAQVGSAEAITTIDLGALGGGYSLARDINNRGQVVGQSERADGLLHAFLWQNGLMIDLGAGEAPSSGAGGINERGQIVGSVGGGASPDRAVLWYEGSTTTLPPLLGRDVSSATAINERGQIVGVSSGLRMPGHAVLWDGADVLDLGVLPAGEWTSSVAAGINNRGQIIGISGPTEQLTVGFIWEAGTMSALSAIRANAINNRGQVAGVVQVPIPGSIETTPYPALLDKGVLIDLRTVPDEIGFANDVNNRGQVVGVIGTFAVGQAFIWQNGILTRLPDLGGGESSATALNERGQVVGYSRTVSGELHAVMWVLH